MQVTPAYLSSVATFYDMLRTTPSGSRYVYVCTSVACHLRDAKALYDQIQREARQDLQDVEVRQFECLGACEMAPMASIDGRYVGPLDGDDARELVAAQGREPFPGRGAGGSDIGKTASCSRTSTSPTCTPSPSTSGWAATGRCARRCSS